MHDYILNLCNIDKIFPGVRALVGMHLELKRGEIHGLVGENGAGKSTLIKIITGVLQPTRGTIELDGETVTFKGPHDAKQKGVTSVYQELNVLDNLSVTDNFFAGNTVRKKKSPFLDYKFMRGKVREVLESMNLSINPDAATSELGLGQKQMIEIGKAIMQNVKVLVLDEPTSSLGQSETSQLFEILKKLKENGISILFVSHKLEEIFEICDTVTVIRDAQHIITSKVSEITKDEMITYMVGRTLGDLYPKKEAKIGETILETRGLRRIGVFRDISFHARRGEILGFYGLVGAGRTELFRAIFAVDQLDSGEILINSNTVRITSPKNAIKNKIAFVTEDRKKEGLVLTQTIRENISMVNMDMLKKGLFIDDKKTKLQADEAVKKFNIKTNSIEKESGELSGGNQQKVVIAKWICLDSDIYIFDEPTRGIDIGAKIDVYNIIMDLVTAGKCVIMISSELPEILGICDRVIVMANGQIKADFDKDSKSFNQEDIMKAAWNRG